MSSESQMNAAKTEWIRVGLTAAALALLVGAVIVVMRPFFLSLGWAAIIAVSTWPVFRALRRLLPRHPALTSFGMTIAVAALFTVIVAPLISMFLSEGRAVFQSAQSSLSSGVPIAELARPLPYIGDPLARLAEYIDLEPENVRRIVSDYETTLLGGIGAIASGVIKVSFQLFVCLFSLYFVYRHGDRLAFQTRSALMRIAPVSASQLITTAHSTVHAVVYGILATALAQGALGAVGYFTAGASYPVFLTGMTVLASIVPFGTPFVYGPAALALIADGELIRGGALLVWGLAVISSIDNVVRAVTISRVVDISIFFVFLGVLGGIGAFGFIGIFLGPVILMTASVLWRDWIASPPSKQ